MYHYLEAIIDSATGKTFIGAYARVLNAETGSSAPIYADNNGTPIATVSGLANAAKTDGDGNLSFFIVPGTYHLDLYDTDGETFIRRFSDIPMTSTQGREGDPGPEGPPGPSNNTRVSLAALKGAATTDKTSLFDGSLWTWTAGDFTGQADDEKIVESDSQPLNVGAWVRQEAAAVTFDVRRTVKQRLELEAFVTDARFAGGAVGDGVADDTAAFKACRDFCQDSGARMRVPAGNYKLTDTIVIGGSFDIEGEGGSVSRLLPVFSTQKPVFDLAPGDNQVVNGMRFSGIGMFGLNSPVAPDFITIRSALVNSTIRQSMFTDLFFQHVRRGISLSGVIYRCTFENITGTDIADIGIYSDLGFIDVTYNTFQQIEMTNVLDGAWAYYIRSSFSTFDTMTSDGVAYFSSPAGVMRNYTTETVQANSYPAAAGNNVVTLNQMQLVDNFTIRGVDPAKRSVALRVIGTSVITAMRMASPHPINPVFLDGGSSGVINTLEVNGPVNMIEATHTDATLNLWTFNNCFQVTKRSMRYGEGRWTPTFTGWSTNPTFNINGTTYDRVGNRIFATLVANGGVASVASQIGGLPFPSSEFSSGVATFSTTDPTKRIDTGSIGPDATVVGSYGSVDMTGTDWTMVVEYRA